VKRLAQTLEPVARVFLILALMLAGLGDEARAAWPERTITIIVPFPAGGPSDLLGRLLAAELAPRLGRTSLSKITLAPLAISEFPPVPAPSRMAIHCWSSPTLC
jgi:hypothetical protein